MPQPLNLSLSLNANLTSLVPRKQFVDFTCPTLEGSCAHPILSPATDIATATAADPLNRHHHQVVGSTTFPHSGKRFVVPLQCSSTSSASASVSFSSCSSGAQHSVLLRGGRGWRRTDAAARRGGEREKGKFVGKNLQRKPTSSTSCSCLDLITTESGAMAAPGELVETQILKEGAAEAEALVPVETAAELIPHALVWAALNGLVVGDRAVEKSGLVAGVGVVHAPLSLLPTPFPKEEFRFAVELSTLFNDLVDKVSQDADFLQETLARTQKADDFTARLLEIHSKMLNEGVKQNIRLGLHRSDYMLDEATGKLLQVELNTISSSFAGLGSLVSKMHKYLVGISESQYGLETARVPENNASDGFAAGLARAWQEYGDRSAAILMIVQPEERNMYDQQWLGFKLMDSHGVRVLRRTLTEVSSEANISASGSLFIGKQLISLVYYRGGYTPDDYPSEKEWEARTVLERSAAIKCPSISYHLTGAKKIQQELAKPGVLERFLTDKQAINTLRKCFAGLWSLEDDGSEIIIEEAIKSPQGFVLKPQREGGGNNIYGDDVASKLSQLRAEGGSGLAAYILMQRIFPAEHASYLVRGGAWSANQTISELGIFGVYIRNGDREVSNECAGHLLRTKVSNSNEGGVAAGFAVLDSPYLT